MDLLVIGAGPVGRAVARAWSAAGHDVRVGVRDPGDAKHDAYRAEHVLTGVAGMPDAEATLLALPGTQLPAFLDANAARLDGRLVIDATNTLGGPRLHRLPLLAERLPGARVYRAFTSTGWENITPEVAGERPDLLYAGPDGTDRATVERLIADTGPRPVWLGAGDGAADVLDAAAGLWFALAFERRLGRHLALRVLTGPSRASAAAPPSMGTRRMVTIVGRGRIGSALGAAFSRAGHAVTYAVRDGDTTTAAGELDLPAALRAGEIVVLALPGPAVEGLVREHAEALSGRLVIDAANLVGANPANSSAVVATVPGARYARAFNSLGVENLLAPDFDGVAGDMIFTATPEDRATVAALVSAVGLRPVWLPPGSEDVVDGVLRLWFTLARSHGRHLAFRILTENPDL